MPFYPVFSKVRIAEQYVTHFVLADVGSRGFINWILIELEPPTDRIFTKDTRPSRHLASAMTQVQDWRRWIGDNIAYARKLFLGRRVRFYFRVIIGRRKYLDDPGTDRLENMHQDLHSSTRIMHYDRLVDVARRIPGAFYEATKGRYCRAFAGIEMKRIMQHFPRSWLDDTQSDPLVDSLAADRFPMHEPP